MNFKLLFLVLSSMFAIEWANKKGKDWKDYLIFLLYLIVVLIIVTYL